MLSRGQKLLQLSKDLTKKRKIEDHISKTSAENKHILAILNTDETGNNLEEQLPTSTNADAALDQTEQDVSMPNEQTIVSEEAENTPETATNGRPR